ncbi:MAG: lactam utilization protein B, partial [Ulvibacter sp.]
SDGAWDQLRLMSENQLVKTKQLNNMSIKASTYCIHSDTSNVVEILSYIREQMKIHHIGLVE